MGENILKDKSFTFAVSVVNMYKYFITEHKEFILSKQLFRSGTSIGANIHEAEFGQSKADFIHKLSITQKETNETIYWLELMKETNYLSETQFESINLEAIALIKIITASIKTAKSNL